MSETGEGPKDPGRRILITGGAVGAAALLLRRLFGKSDERLIEAASRAVTPGPQKFPTKEDPLKPLFTKTEKAEARKRELSEGIAMKFAGREVADLEVEHAGQKPFETATFMINTDLGVNLRYSPVVPIDKEESKIGAIPNGKIIRGIQFVINYKTQGKEWSWAAVRPQELENFAFIKPDSQQGFFQAGERQYVFFCIKEGDSTYAAKVPGGEMELD